MKGSPHQEITKKQQSDSSRFVGLNNNNNKNNKKNDKATTFSFCKVLLRTVSHSAQLKTITLDEVIIIINHFHFLALFIFSLFLLYDHFYYYYYY